MVHEGEVEGDLRRGGGSGGGGGGWVVAAVGTVVVEVVVVMVVEVVEVVEVVRCRRPTLLAKVVAKIVEVEQRPGRAVEPRAAAVPLLVDAVPRSMSCTANTCVSTEPPFASYRRRSASVSISIPAFSKSASSNASCSACFSGGSAIRHAMLRSSLVAISVSTAAPSSMGRACRIDRMSLWRSSGVNSRLSIPIGWYAENLWRGALVVNERCVWRDGPRDAPFELIEGEVLKLGAKVVHARLLVRRVAELLPRDQLAILIVLDERAVDDPAAPGPPHLTTAGHLNRWVLRRPP